MPGIEPGLPQKALYNLYQDKLKCPDHLLVSALPRGQGPPKSLPPHPEFMRESQVEPQRQEAGRCLTLSLVVEISAFKISGSYLVLEEEPENT